MRFTVIAAVLLAASILAPASRSPAQDGPPRPPAQGESPAVLLLRAGTMGGREEPLRDLEFEVVGPDGASVRAKADGEGRASVEVRPGERYTVIGRASGFIRGHERTETLQAGSRADVFVLLAKARPIEGTVRSAADGRPVAGATVRVFDEPFFVHPWCGTGVITDPVPPVEVLVTDREGRFTAHRTSVVLEGLDLGMMAVLVEAPGFRPGVAESMAPEDPEGKPLEVRLEAGATLRGTVRTPDGRPVAGARVLSLCRSDFALDPSEPLKGVPLDTLELPEGWYVTSEVVWKALRTRSGPDGGFVLDGLEPGKSYHAYAVAGGWACSAMATDILAPDAGKSVERDFRLRAPGKVRVTLKGTEEDAPPAGVEWTLRSPGRMRRLDPIPSGTRSFENLEPGDYTLEIRCPATAPRVEAFRLEEGEVREVALDLAAGVSIEGIVVDDTGAPVPGAEVEARPKDGPRVYSSDSGVTTDAEGRFRIPGLKPGTYEVRAAKVKVGSSERTPVEAPADGVRIAMPRFGSFRVALLREEGDEGPSTLHWNAKFSFGGHSNSRPFPGRRFDFREYECLDPGEFVISFRVKGYAPVSRTLRIEPGRTIELEDVPLERGGRLQGRVVDDEGNPVAEGEVRVEFPGWGWDTVVRSRTDAEGRFLLEHLPRGDLTVRLESGGEDGVVCAEEKVVVGPDPLPEVSWVAPRPARLDVVVLDPDGNLLRGVRVRAEGLEGDPESRIQPLEPTDDEGRVGMVLRAGRYRLSLQASDEFVPVQEITLARGERTEIRLVLTPRKGNAGGTGR